jgi:hypothetical protein
MENQKNANEKIWDRATETIIKAKKEQLRDVPSALAVIEGLEGIHKAMQKIVLPEWRQAFGCLITLGLHSPTLMGAAAEHLQDFISTNIKPGGMPDDDDPVLNLEDGSRNALRLSDL